MIYDVQIEELETMALFELQGAPELISDWCGSVIPPLPEVALTFSESSDSRLIWTGRNRWLLQSSLDKEGLLNDALRPTVAPDSISVVRISDTMKFFSVKGQDAWEVMSIATPLDTHSSVFPYSSATYTEVFLTKALVMRLSDEFLIGVDRSYGAMFSDYFSRCVR